MSKYPYFDFAGQLATHSSDEEMKPAIRSDIFTHPEPQIPSMSDHIRKIFEDSDDDSDDPRFHLHESKEQQVFPPGLVPLPFHHSKSNSSLPSYNIGGYDLNRGNANLFPNVPHHNENPLESLINPNFPNLIGGRKIAPPPKNNFPNPYYNVQVNDDIYLIERIESILPQISANHNPYCPFCLKYIGLKKSNFQNVSAYYSKTMKKHYLTHFDCYYKAKDRTFKIKSLSQVPQTRPNTQDQMLDLNQFTRRDRKIYFMSIEALHPISSYLHFRVEKSAFAMEEPLQGQQVLSFDFEKKTTSFYEPNAFVMPYSEFRCQLIIASCPTNEEPYTFEFLINASSINLTHDNPERKIEFLYNQNGNFIYIGFQAILDIDNRIANSMNYKVPIPERSNSHEPAKILVLKYLSVVLPIYRRSNKIQTVRLADSKINEDDEFNLGHSPNNGHDNFFSPQQRYSPDRRTFHDMIRETESDAETDRRDVYDSPPTVYKRADLRTKSSITPGTKFDLSKFKNYDQRTGHSAKAVVNNNYDSDKHSASSSLENLDKPNNNHMRQRQNSMPKSLSFVQNFETDDLLNSESAFKLTDYQGKLFDLAKSPSGSRMIQMFIPKANASEIDVIIEELKPHLSDVLLDAYANYMFQTLMQYSSPQQRYTLLYNINALIPQIACHKKGTHSLQAIISIIKGEEEEKLLEQGLEDHVLELSKDTYGTHFIQKLVSSLSVESISFVFNAVVKNFMEIAEHSYGLCVLKALITKIEKDEEKKRTIIRCIAEKIDDLIQNAFGNYAIQHAFDTYKDDCGEICEQIAPKILQFSNQKFSSNVVEKCLETASLDNRRKLIESVIKNEKLIELMTNKYGNFVLLKVYNLADDREKKNLHSALQRNFAKIHSSKYRSRWTAFFEECGKRPSEIPSKILNKQPKAKELSDSIKRKKNSATNSVDVSDDNEDSADKKFIRKKTKKMSHFVPKPKEEETAEFQRSKNRKFSAPIGGLKFSTNFS